MKKKKPRRDKNTMSSFSYTFTDFEAEWFIRKLFPHGNNLRVSRKLLQIVQAAKNAIFLAISLLLSLLLLLLLLLSLPPSLPPSLSLSICRICVSHTTESEKEGRVIILSLWRLMSWVLPLGNLL
jgi:hypothetical protein